MVGASVFTQILTPSPEVSEHGCFGALMAQLTLVGVAEINNEYDDLLGTGQKAETQIVCIPLGFGISGR